MKQTRLFALLLAGGLLLNSCGSKTEETENAENSSSTTSENATQNNVSTANVEAAPRTAGAAVSADVLKSFIPNPSGYTADGDIQTTQAKMGELEYSVANQSWTNGNKHLKVTIADYNGVQALTAAYSMLMNMSVETNGEVTKGEKFGGHPGWVQYHKDNSQAQIGVAVNDRLWLIAEGDNGATIDEVRALVNSIDLNKLASASK
jgi:hypothetical protein